MTVGGVVSGVKDLVVDEHNTRVVGALFVAGDMVEGARVGEGKGLRDDGRKRSGDRHIFSGVLTKSRKCMFIPMVWFHFSNVLWFCFDEGNKTKFHSS